MFWRNNDDDDDERVVVVERNGDSTLKVFLLGALVGAGLALLYAPQSGDQTRRSLKRRLRSMRAMAEEKLGDLGERFGDREHALTAEDLDDAAEDGEDALEDLVEEAPPSRGRGRPGAREELERRLDEARARRRGEPLDDEEAGA